jgi:hypothetical protein
MLFQVSAFHPRFPKNNIAARDVSRETSAAIPLSDGQCRSADASLADGPYGSSDNIFLRNKQKTLISLANGRRGMTPSPRLHSWVATVERQEGVLSAHCPAFCG